MTRLAMALSCLSLLASGSRALALEGEALRGVPLRSGARVEASLDRPGDVDSYRLAVPAGAGVRVRVKSKGPLSPPLRLSLFDALDVTAGASARLKGQGSRRVLLDHPGAGRGGHWRLDVESGGPEGGDYSLQFATGKVRPLKMRDLVLAAGQSLAYPVGAGAGDRVTLVLAAPEPGALAWELTDGAGATLGAGSRDGEERSRSLRGRMDMPSDLVGEPGLRISNPGTVSITFSLGVKVRSPRRKGSRIALLPEPLLTGASPDNGRDGVEVTISGADIPPGSGVLFGCRTAEVVEAATDGIRCVAPESADSVDGAAVTITVLLPDGQPVPVPSTFRFTGVPRLLSIHPGLCATEGGTPLTISGLRFREGYSVVIGGKDATAVTFPTAVTLGCIAPPHTAGTWAVVVRDEFGRTASNSLSVRYADAPAVTTAGPLRVPSYADARLELDGTDFVPGTRVRVGGLEATTVTLLSGTRLVATLPAAPPGTATLVLLDEIGRSTTYPDFIERTRSWHNLTTTVVPLPPAGSEIGGTSVEVGRISGYERPQIFVSFPEARAHGENGFMTGLLALWQESDGRIIDRTEESVPPLVASISGDFAQADHIRLHDLDGDGGLDLLMTMATLQQATAMCGNYNNQYVVCNPNTAGLSLFASRALVYDAYRDGWLKQEFLAWSQEPHKAFLYGGGAGTGPDGGREELFQGDFQLIGDLDGDGDDDLVLGSESTITLPQFGKAIEVRYVLIAGVLTRIEVPVTVVLGSYEIPSTRLFENRGLLNNQSPGSFQKNVNGFPLLVHDFAGDIVEDWAASAGAMGDLDGDGRMELVLATSRARSGPRSGFPSSLRILRHGEEDALVHVPESVPTPPSATSPASRESWQASSILLQDLDGDGRPEILLGRERADAVKLEGGFELIPALRVLRNDGAGVFSEANASLLDPDLVTGNGAIHTASRMRAVDLDGDGIAEIVIGGPWDSIDYEYGNSYVHGFLGVGVRRALRVLRLGKDGVLHDATEEFLQGPVNGDQLAGADFEVADLDNDGHLDLVIISMVPPLTPLDASEPNRALRVLMNR